MKRLISAIIGAILCITGALSAQQPAGGTANIAGTLYASNFARWTAAQGTNGPFSWSSPQVCTAANVGGITFQPFKIGTPVQIVDTATPANSEIVTPTAVNVNGSGCSITVATTKTHYSFYLGSATAGLQESINYANGQPYVVVITSDFTRLGGTTAMIVNAKGNSAVSILDERSSMIVPYLWSTGTNTYFPQPFGSGGVPATPQYAVQYAGPGATAFNADPTFMFNTSTHGLSAYMTNGAFNTDVAATGGGNNGIANLISGPCVTAGCFFARPFTSTDNESITLALKSATEYAHGLDSTYGTAQNFFWNAGINAAGQGGRFADPTLCFWNDTDLTSNATHDCQHSYIVEATNGIDVGSPWSTAFGHPTDMYTYTRGITQMQSSNLFCFHVGDCMSKYNYLWYRGGSTETNDESIKGIDQQLNELPGPYGTITTGGANATTIKANFTTNAGNQGDGYDLVSTSEVISTGLITGETAGSGDLLNSIATSDTHAVSTGYGTLTASCGANVSRAFPVSYTCPISVISGSFSSAANATVCIGDYRNPEQSKITATGSGTITVGLTYAHPSGTPVYQGGGCGGKLALGYGLADPFSAHKFTSYYIAGSLSATSYDYIIPLRGGQDGQNAIKIPSVLLPLTFASISRTANVVTAQVAGGYPLNNFIAPGGAQVVVTGVTPSDFNGTVTGAISSTVNTLTWNQTGSDESGGSGTIAVTGYNNYSVACGAETVWVKGVTLRSDNSPVLDGTLQQEPNNCLWTPGSPVTQVNAPAIEVTGEEFDLQGDTAPISESNVGRTVYTGGNAWSAGIEENYLTTDHWDDEVGGGGTRLPKTHSLLSNFYGIVFNLVYAPVNGGRLFNIGCPPDGCGSTYDYSIVEADGTNGASRFKFSPGTGDWYIENPFAAETLNGTSAIGVNPSATATVGTNAFGGWFTPNGNSFDSLNNNTLDLGNGNPGDSSGTLGANTVYVPNMIAGVRVPTLSTFAVFVQGTTGSTTYTYACTAYVPGLGETPAITRTIYNGNATPSSSNYNEPACSGVPGATSERIYRTAGGATTGLIGTIPNTFGASLKDTGLTGDGTSPPTTNTTGHMDVYGPLTAESATVGGSPVCTMATGCTGGGGSGVTQIVAGTNVTITPSGGTGVVTVNASGGGMVYPGAGVPVSTGAAWGTSKATPAGALVGDTDTQTLTNKTLDGVTPTTMSFLDATSSIQTQLNSKGNTTSSTLTTNAFPKATGANSIGNSAVSDDGTSVTSTEPIAVNCTSSSCPSQLGITYNSAAAPTVGSATTAVYAVNSSGQAVASEATGAFSRICTAANGVCTGSGIANVTVTLPTSAIAANTCTTAATVTMTGLATTSVFDTAFATNPNAVTGWGSTGGLTFTAWPTANTLNWSVCNATAASITPGAMTLNVGAR